MKMRIVFVWLALAWACGCASSRGSYLNPYAIGKVGPLRYSNSLNYFERSPEVRSTGYSSMKVHGLIENPSDDSYKIQLGDVWTEPKTVYEPPRCRIDHQVVSTVRIGPGEVVDFVCEVDVYVGLPKQFSEPTRRVVVMVPVDGLSPVPFYIDVTR